MEALMNIHNALKNMANFATSSCRDQTPEDCALKRLILRCWATKEKPDTIAEGCRLCPQTFIDGILRELVVVRYDRNALHPSYKYRCDYHEHDESVPKGPECVNSPEFIKKQKKSLVISDDSD
jgi:hypothetical protein